jgi:AraC-like DNA-binding protein
MRESPFRFLLRYRVEKGCKLLLSTSMTVTEISAEVGLCTSSYFYETFKRIKGNTPSEFRAQNR